MSELEDLRVEVERLTGHVAEWREAAHHNKRRWIAAVERAESAEAKYRALVDSPSVRAIRAATATTP